MDVRLPQRPYCRYRHLQYDSYDPLAQVRDWTTEDGESRQQTNYFHCDQIGIPREMTDSQGKLLWKGRYDAWGQLIHDSNRHAQRNTHQPFRLQNQYFDQETGLHYNFLRYYEPALGRFITQDPIGLMGGMNLYQFAANAQGHIDVLGLSATLSDFEDEVISPLPSWDKESKGSLGSWGTVMVGGVVLGTVGIISSEQVDSTESQSKTVNISSCSEKEKRKRCKNGVWEHLSKRN